jgi:peptide/nickel transport system permease protein
MWRLRKRDQRATLSLSTVVLIVFVALVLAGPLLAPSDPLRTEAARQLLPPDATALFGTDLLGRDVFSRFLYGGQRTLLIALGATLVALIPGGLLGLAFGSSPRWLDRTGGVILNAVLAFPGLALALIVLTLVGSGMLPLILATGLAQVAPCILIARAAVVSVRTAGYVEASHAAGAGAAQVAMWHLLPNILPTLLAYSGVIFSFSILNSAALSFLGFSEPGIPDWGVMLAEGRQAFRVAPWIGAAPGIGIALLVWLTNRVIARL